MKYSDRKNRQRLYLYTYIIYILYTSYVHITVVVQSRQCLFTYFYLYVLTQLGQDGMAVILQTDSTFKGILLKYHFSTSIEEITAVCPNLQ